MTLTVRPMTWRDLERVYSINLSSFTTDSWSLESFKREFNLHYSHRFVLEKDGEVIGYAVVWLIDGEAFLMTFAIDGSHRNKGLGRFFLKQLIKILKGKARVLQLDVRKSNLPAIRLYKSLGFKVVRERPKFYSDGETAFLMELKLDKMEGDGEDKGQSPFPADRTGGTQEEGKGTRPHHRGGLSGS